MKKKNDLSPPNGASVDCGVENNSGQKQYNTLLSRNVSTQSVSCEGNTVSTPKLVKIDKFDIEEEIRYWETVVVCFVVGTNPPLHVIDGFVQRIWKDLELDTIGMVDKGVYIVRMKSCESREKAYESNGVLFDNKPFVIKSWTPKMSTDKNSLSSMPVWIQLPKLKAEYRSEASLKKIADIVAKVIKIDNATRKKARLRFARVLVEMNTIDDFSDEIHFTNVKNE